MQDSEILALIDKQKIYQTVLDLEGPRYPLENMDALNAAADFIADELTSYGLKVEMQEFKVVGMDEPFRNVIGYLGDQSSSSMLLGSHYDSVSKTPGANDNLSGVAISLEAARVLAQMENPPSVIVAVFTLEEGQPFLARQIRAAGREHGLYDEQYRFTDVRMLEFSEIFGKLYLKYFYQGKRGSEAVEMIKTELEGKLSEDERLYLDIQSKARKVIEDQSSFSNPYILVGSHYYVNKLAAEGTKIRGAIVLETVGWNKDEPHTQKVLPIPPEMLQVYKLDLENEVGNFVAVGGDVNSSELLKSFLSYCEDSAVDMPYYGVDLPFGYPQIFAHLPDLLRSDHAPFWEAGIPAILITDTANFRSELYHTPADISASVDYEVLLKVTKATVKTVIDS